MFPRHSQQILVERSHLLDPTVKGDQADHCLLLSCFPAVWRLRDPGLSTVGERKCGLHEAVRGQERPQREDRGGLSWGYSFPRASVTNVTD